ncbi:MAG: protein kinase [Planctomycetes bacterium]|nr:protein kinase [Planctomycetota bacterium]
MTPPSTRELRLVLLALRRGLVTESQMLELRAVQEVLSRRGEAAPSMETLLLEKAGIRPQDLDSLRREVEAPSADSDRDPADTMLIGAATPTLLHSEAPGSEATLQPGRLAPRPPREGVDTLAPPVRIRPDDNSTVTHSPTLQGPSAAPPAGLGSEPSVKGRPFGRYRLLFELGRGGMGIVYKAWDCELRREVALKTLARHAVEEPEAVERFRREARSAARLRHPNIVQLHDVGQWEGTHYLTMDFIDGGNLESAMRSLLPRRFIEILRDVSLGLQAAHEAGIVHRDIKPANILLDRHERPFLTDFGLAREWKSQTEAPMTQSGAVLGTPQYMSPEHASGRPETVVPASDLWSLGVVLYEYLAGRRPFEAPGQLQVLWNVFHEDPVAPTLAAAKAGRRAVHRDLETICLKCLEKEPARRYPSAAELAADLGRFLIGEPIAARPASLRHRAWRGALRHKSGTAAAATFAATLATFALVHFRTPGTLQLTVRPAGARVAAGPNTWTSDGGAHAVSLAAGVYDVSAELPDHAPERREVALQRGGWKELVLDLRHDQGAVDVESEPPGSELLLDDVPYGSKIRNLPVDTGPHRLRAQAEGFFDREAGLAVARGRTARGFLSLEAATHWIVHLPDIGRSTSAARPIPDVDGDGSRDLLVQEGVNVLLLRGVDAKALTRFQAARSVAFRALAADLGGELGSVLLLVTEETSGLVVTCVDPRRPGERAKVWSWTGPAQSWKHPWSPALALLPDANADGVTDLAVGGRDEAIWLLDGRTGKELRRLATPVYPFVQVVFDAGGAGAVNSDGGRLFFIGKHVDPGESPAAAKGPLVVGAVRLPDGGPAWSAELEEGTQAAVADRDGDGRAEVWSWRGSEVTVRDGGTGALRWKRSFPETGELETLGGPVTGGPTHPHLLLLPGRGGTLAAIDVRDGTPVWCRAVRPASAPESRPMCLGALGARVLVSQGTSLTALAAADGAPGWSVAGRFSRFWTVDVDGDGEQEILAAVPQEGLACLEADGRLRWMLRLQCDVAGVDEFGDVDGDGLSDLLLRGETGLLALARQPRQLWVRRASGALRATPVVLDADGDGRPEVVSLGPWGADRYLACLDGASGLFRWFDRRPAAPNRGPGVADRDGDGRPEIYLVGEPNAGVGYSLYSFRAADGELLARLPLDHGQVYSVPLLADLNGDGVKDVVFHRWGQQDVLALDGARDGATLWRYRVGAFSMGGVAAADLDGDGRPDVVAPFMDGFVYALRGTDGTLLWKAPIGPGGSRAPASLADLNGDGTPDVLLVAASGALWALDGRTGARLGTIKGGTEAWGRPAVVPRPEGGPLVVAPMGQAGVVAIEWRKGATLWTAAAGKNVMTSPIVCDLDKDGIPEVVIACGDGEVSVLDLATGRRLWGVRVAEAAIEADPVVADLDGDGVLDILVADYSGRLQALSGRATAGSRRRK